MADRQYVTTLVIGDLMVKVVGTREEVRALIEDAEKYPKTPWITFQALPMLPTATLGPIDIRPESVDMISDHKEVDLDAYRTPRTEANPLAVLLGQAASPAETSNKGGVEL